MKDLAFRVNDGSAPQEPSTPVATEGNPTTFLGVVRERVRRSPDHRIFRFLDASGQNTTDCSYAMLDNRARSVAAAWQRLGVQGERVLILLAPGLDYVTAFLGCLYAGAVAVPAYPPRTTNSLLRVDAIASNARCKFVIASPELTERRTSVCERVPSLLRAEWLSLPDPAEPLECHWLDPDLQPNSLAFLQYTSGSSASPKGVMVSHGNLAHNCSLIQRAFGPQSRPSLTWLPPYHDMGLIGGLLAPLFTGVEQFVMTPAQFLRSPLLWLDCISRFGIGCTGAPNFAYELCVAAAERESRRFDLSSWEVAFMGAEPIRKRTLERFVARFAADGFSERSFFTTYGLAEATLFVSGSNVRAKPVLELDGSAYRAGRAAPADANSSSVVSVVSCGTPGEPDAVVIVNPSTGLACAEDEFGEVWVSSSSIALGYWEEPTDTERVFRARLPGSPQTYLRTGDTGLVHDGELYIQGRLKDVLIVRGVKHHAADIELTVQQSHDALLGMCSAAFSVDVDGEERIVVVSELPTSTGSSAELAELATSRVTREHGVRPHHLEFVRIGSLPRTSSGKIQRFKVRESYLNDQLHLTADRLGRNRASETAPPPRTSSGLDS